jgi:hypothetical protein
MLHQGWVHLPYLVATTPVLVAIADAPLRIEVAAALVCNGFRIVLARTGAQLTALLPSAAIVIVDGKLLAAVRPAARARLERVRVLHIADPEEIDGVLAAALDAVS